MIKIIIFSLLYITFYSIGLAETIPSSQITNIKHQEHIQLENYTPSVIDEFSMFGFMFDTYLTSNLYYTLAIHGAIAGKTSRGGYGVGMFGLGTDLPVNDQLTATGKFLVGGGGGGQLPVNGGLALRYQLGLRYNLTPRLCLDLDYGQITFPTGQLASRIYSIGISYPIFQYEKDQNLSEMQKHKESYLISTKAFDYNPGETIKLFGCGQKSYLNDNIYIGKAGYGAVSGKRSGYIEGGMIAGMTSPLTEKIFYEFNLFTGVGGGGLDTAKEGGGFLINPSLGIGTLFSGDYGIITNLGYIKYINGTLESFSLTFNLLFNYWSLHD